MIRRIATVALCLLLPGCSSDRLPTGAEVIIVPPKGEQQTVIFQRGKEVNGKDFFVISPGTKARVVTDENTQWDTDPGSRPVTIHALEGELQGVSFDVKRDALRKP